MTRRSARTEGRRSAWCLGFDQGVDRWGKATAKFAVISLQSTVYGHRSVGNGSRPRSTPVEGGFRGSIRPDGKTPAQDTHSRHRSAADPNLHISWETCGRLSNWKETSRYNRGWNVKNIVKYGVNNHVKRGVRKRVT